MSGPNRLQTWELLGIVSLAMLFLFMPWWLSLSSIGLLVGLVARRVRRDDIALLQYKTAVEQAVDGVALSDMDGNIQFVNGAWAKMHGFRVEELVGQQLSIFHTPEQMEAEVNPFFEVLLRQDANEGEVNHVRKDKTVFPTWMTTTVIRDKQDRRVAMLGIARDISERKQAEEALRSSISLLNATLESTEDGILTVNETGEVVAFNQRFLQIWQIPMELAMERQEEKLLQYVIDCVQDPDAFLTGIRHLYDNPEETSFDAIALADGRWLERYSQPQRLGEEIIGRVWSFRDVTNRKTAEAQLVAYTIELEQREKEMDRLYNVLDTEMQNARKAHQRLVQQSLPKPEGIALAALHNPATFIGGDFVYALQRDELLVVYITDITGHGLEGTIFGLFVKGCIESYLELVPKSEIVPEAILAYLDQQVHKSGYPSEHAVAIFLMVINVDTKETVFSAAGFQNPPVLVHPSGSLEMLISRGLPISPDIPPDVVEFCRHMLHFPKDAVLFLATDGIYEQRQGNEMYEKRLLNLLKQCSRLPHTTVSDRVHADFRDFLGANKQDDDVTFVVLSTGDTKEYTLPSSWDSLAVIREYALAYYQDHRDCDAILMAVHELVANAIEHGNRCCEDKQVRVTLSKRAVVVEDEGEGFVWRSRVPSELSLALDQERGRGIAMVQMLVGDLVYNEKGNRVSLLLQAKE